MVTMTECILSSLEQKNGNVVHNSSESLTKKEEREGDQDVI